MAVSSAENTIVSAIIDLMDEDDALHVDGQVIEEYDANLVISVSHCDKWTVLIHWLKFECMRHTRTIRGAQHVMLVYPTISGKAYE